MNFFLKNRLIFWLLIFLVAVNLSALITFLVFFSEKITTSSQRPQVNAGMAFRKELSLSPAQFEKVEVILAEYTASTDPIRDNIRNYRALLLEELAKDKPDTNILNRFTDDICLLQKQMQIASAKQYMALKEICTPVQCQKLSSLYFEMYGCQGKGKGMGRGKGMMHQYRGGKGQQGSGGRMGMDSCNN